MKIFHLVLFFFSLHLLVDGQRRVPLKSEITEPESTPKPTRRGRARFVVPPTDQQEDEPKRKEPGSRRVVIARRKQEGPVEIITPRRSYEIDTALPSKNQKINYEVEEIIDDTPFEMYKKNTKSAGRVFTETRFEAQNAPPTSPLFQPSTTESLDEIVRSIGSDLLDATNPPVPPNPTSPIQADGPAVPQLDSSPSEASKIENEIAKSQTETTTPATLRATRRSNGRSRTNGASTINPAPVPVPTRIRSRTRPNRKQEEPTPATASTPSRNPPSQRGARRRLEIIEPRSRAPSVIAAAETVEIPTRSRTGRRIPGSRARAEENKSPEKISIDLTPSRRNINNRRAPPENPNINNNRRNIETTPASINRRIVETTTVSNNRNSFETTTPSNNRKSFESTTIRGRSRFRSRDLPPIIDEQKLEVLPLFERETSKTVRPVRKGLSRRRTLSSAEEVDTSATENDIKLVSKPSKESVVVETRTESNIKQRKPSTQASKKPITQTNKKPTGQPSTKPTSRASTRPTSRTSAKPTSRTSTKPTSRASTKATTRTSPKPSVKTSKPFIKQSVVSEITEVTSKRTVLRKVQKAKVEAPKFVERGKTKSEVNVSEVKKSKSSSEDEIDESDNYPEQFKALLQAKKKQESRSQQRLVTVLPIVTKTAEKVATSSPSTTTSRSTTTTRIVSSEAPRQIEDFENELDGSSPRPTRRRLPLSTEKSIRTTKKSNKVARSTTAVPLSVKDQRFHAKINIEPEPTTNPLKSSKFSPKPTPRGLYSTRKNKESLTKNKSSPGQIPAPKKSNRYSSRYRNDASSRGAIRTSTNAPAYLPTIPTITPPTTSDYVWPEEENFETVGLSHA